MYPPPGIADQLIAVRDAFDVPVFVRRSSPLTPKRRMRQVRIDKALLHWPADRDIPPDGDYMVTTTWRDVMTAAMTVGRDPAPWLAAVPDLAWSELLARWSPLMAYLGRTKAPGSERTSKYCLEPNAVYHEATEKTAQAAFGYRIGMTMAEWACRGLMGLGPTRHAEAYPPLRAGPDWTPGQLPDLVGDHWQSPTTWLIEAKGLRRLGLTALRKGAEQLSRPGLMEGSHVRVLCGTSLEHRLFMTIDVEESYMPEISLPAPGGSSTLNPEPNDDELLALARSQMLTYYSLAALPRGSRVIRPVGPSVLSPQTWEGRIGLVLPLEMDESTAHERTLAREQGTYTRLRNPEQFLDMLIGRVPGTDVVVGMSRRLFTACSYLAEEDATDLAATQAENDDLVALDNNSKFDASDEEIEENLRARRKFFAERETSSRPRQLDAVREGFEQGRSTPWSQLLRTETEVDAQGPENLLEAATAHTYIAVRSERYG